MDYTIKRHHTAHQPLNMSYWVFVLCVLEEYNEFDSVADFVFQIKEFYVPMCSFIHYPYKYKNPHIWCKANSVYILHH